MEEIHETYERYLSQLSLRCINRYVHSMKEFTTSYQRYSHDVLVRKYSLSTANIPSEWIKVLMRSNSAANFTKPI